MNTYAYIRVSTKEQNIDRQMVALEPYHIPKRNIYCDYQSGRDFERSGYRKLMKRLRHGDLLIVKSIDRLGRNYNDILAEWQYITKEIGADIKVLDMELLDTRTKGDSLTGTLIADLVLQIFAYAAQLEREFIRQRQAEGIAAAKARGRKWWRDPMELPDEFEELYHAYKDRRISTREAGRRLGVSHTTFHRRCRERDKEKQKNSKKSVTVSRLDVTDMLN